MRFGPVNSMDLPKATATEPRRHLASRMQTRPVNARMPCAAPPAKAGAAAPQGRGSSSCAVPPARAGAAGPQGRGSTSAPSVGNLAFLGDALWAVRSCHAGIRGRGPTGTPHIVGAGVQVAILLPSTYYRKPPRSLTAACVAHHYSFFQLHIRSLFLPFTRAHQLHALIKCPPPPQLHVRSHFLSPPKHISKYHEVKGSTMAGWGDFCLGAGSY